MSPVQYFSLQVLLSLDRTQKDKDDLFKLKSALISTDLSESSKNAEFLFPEWFPDTLQDEDIPSGSVVYESGEEATGAELEEIMARMGFK